jgi:hypothetical protein
MAIELTLLRHLTISILDMLATHALYAYQRELKVADGHVHPARRPCLRILLVHQSMKSLGAASQADATGLNEGGICARGIL